MNKSMLLFDALPVLQMDFGSTMLNDRQSGLNQMHRVLPVETGADAFGEMWVGNTAHNVARAAQ